MGATKETQIQCSTDSTTRRKRWSLRRLRTRQDGVALVEFALVLPVLTLLLFGMLDLGKVTNYWIDQTHLANEGARWAVVDKNPGATQTPAVSLQQYIANQADSKQLKKDVSVKICFPNGTSNVGDPVKVIVTSNYSFLGVLTHALPLTGKPPKAAVDSTNDPNPLTATAVMRLEAPPSNYTADGPC